MADQPVLHLSLPVNDLRAARDFYETTLGCRIGRTREDWFDAWFFGLQLTLQLRPLEVIDKSHNYFAELRQLAMPLFSMRRI